MSRDLHDFQCLFFPSFCEASSHNNVYLKACLSCSSDIDMIIIMFTYIFVLAIFFHSHTAERVRLFLACDHALSLYLCNLFSGRGHDTFLSQITCKKARIWTFSDWIGNNMDDLRCSHWPKRRHPLVVVDFSLHFCLRINEQWIHTRVRYELSAGSVFMNLKNV